MLVPELSMSPQHGTKDLKKREEKRGSKEKVLQKTQHMNMSVIYSGLGTWCCMTLIMRVKEEQ